MRAVKTIRTLTILFLLPLICCSCQSTGKHNSEEDLFSEDSSYIEDLTGTALSEFYDSMTDKSVPLISVVANGKNIAYTAVKSEDVPLSVIENGTWFVKIARANLKERPVVARDDIIHVTFTEDCPESVTVIDHWLCYAPPVGFSNLGTKYIPEEMKDMVQRNTTIYTPSDNSFSFSTGTYKYPNETHLSSVKGVILRGIQLKCSINGRQYEYFFIFHTEDY